MASLVDKIITSSIPSYDLSIGAHVLFNSTDVGVDDSSFMVSRIKLADAVRDRRKMATVGHSLMNTPLTIPNGQSYYETIKVTTINSGVRSFPMVKTTQDAYTRMP